MAIALDQLFRTLVCPALVCAVVLVLARRLWPTHAASPGWAALGAAVGTASGYTVAHGLVVGWSYFAPIEKRDWLPCVSLLLIALLAAERAPPLRRVWTRWGLRILLSGLATYLVVRPSAGLALAGMTVAVSGLWLAVESLARRRAGAGPAWSSLIALAAGGAVLALSGSASFGQLAVALAACLAVLALVAWRNPDLRFLEGASGMVVVLPAVLWLNLRRYSYTEVPVTSALLVGAAMVSGWAVELDALRRLRPWPRASVYLLAALLPAALAVLVAWSGWEPPEEYGD